jgi:hypothetical protein
MVWRESVRQCASSMVLESGAFQICQVFVIQQAQLRFEHLVEVGMEDAEEVRGREGEYSPVTCCFEQPTT